MLLKSSGSFETKMVNEAKEILSEGGLKALALTVYQSTVDCQEVPFSVRKKRDVFFSGLVYSEFYADDDSLVELSASEDLRQVFGKRIGVDTHHLFIATENIFQPGRYEYPLNMKW